MTLEAILLLCIYAFVLLGVFLGDSGPLATFKKSGPRLAARVERNVATGIGFKTLPTKEGGIDFTAPAGGGGGGP